jgi:hypothetical protein
MIWTEKSTPKTRIEEIEREQSKGGGKPKEKEMKMLKR